MADLNDVSPTWWKGTDFIVTGRGDTAGYSIYIGREKDKYVFRPLATIQPHGYAEDEWLGYQCVAGDRKSVIVTVLPRWAVNKPILRDRGALAYSVSLVDGTVKPVANGVAFKYHALGCGTSSVVVLLRHLATDQAATEILAYDLDTGRTTSYATVHTQLTSPVPVAGRVLALRGTQVVEVGRDALQPKVVARTTGQAFQLAAGENGTVDLLSMDGKDVRVQVLEGTRLRALAKGPAHSVQLFSGLGGHNTAVGIESSGDRGPGDKDGVRVGRSPTSNEAHPSRFDAVSVEGKVGLAVAHQAEATASPPHADHAPTTPRPASPSTPQLVSLLSGRVLAGDPPVGRSETTVTTVPRASGIRGSNDRQVTGMAQFTTPACGVPRNNPRRTALSATHPQVNWAVEMASRNLLTGALGRPANHLGSGLPAFNPSSDFPVPYLKPNGGHIPPALMNGLLAQESAYKQASRRVLPGSGGNPVISDYYGAAGTLDTIDYNKADCGYGISQITTGMRASETSISANGRAKIAIDYAENIQAGMNILAKKWNQLYDAGIRLNDSNPAYLENWYMALWAYNSGVQPGPQFGNTTGCTPSPTCTDPYGNWGLGWTNNPMNNDYPPNRAVFLQRSYADAERPSEWPYQERVLGFAGTPIKNYRGQDSYPKAQPGSQASGLSIYYPGSDLFCNASNNCDPTTADRCSNANRQFCWWHSSVTFTLCEGGCGVSGFVMAPGASEPPPTNPWKPACDSGLGPAAIIVDDLSDPNENIFCPTRDWVSRGTFSYTVGKTAGGMPLGEIDFHQIATGLGAHSWMAGNRLAADTAHHVTGTWTPANLARGPYVIKVHIPTAGASATSAIYQISTAGGVVSERVINQHEHYNHWKSLGVFQLDENAKVELTNVTRNDTKGGSGTVAWDAVAFVPAPGTYVEHTIDAVALFDEDTNLDSAFPLSWVPGPMSSMQKAYDWAMGHTGDILALPGCNDSTPAHACVKPATRQVMQKWRDDVVAAGTHPTDHPDGKSAAVWMGFANPYTDRPDSDSIPSWFDSQDLTYKIRQKVTVSYVKGSDGIIVPGSADARYDNRTGNTKVPHFILDFFTSTAAEYGAPRPDLRYTVANLNEYDHKSKAVDPASTGIMLGQAYPFAGKDGVVTDSAGNPVTSGGRCVAALGVAGGMIAWRPMIGVAYVSTQVEGWARWLNLESTAGRVPAEIAALASSIHAYFYKNGQPPNGSLFNNAAPIWQELNFRACSDGSIRKIAGDKEILRASHMPDQYLYHNGRAMNMDGTPRNDAKPVLHGNFIDFSKLPAPNDGYPHWPHPWGPCDYNTGRSGNPWDMVPIADDAGEIPSTIHFCLDRTLPTDPDHS
ncbi:hypothetical protein [Nonomuraea lactucae]|uniref:golvesin C-terminal-like domain-containing protein n=1 Tax=Nonomuraea lactucae TaxID=2249762 RepID=UPI0013B37694|nr:hypothetical protein [Nonomuraea lactucae]